jgi:hypothetical protein
MNASATIRQGEHHSVLSLRRTSEGLVLEGEAPDVHLLASSFVERGVSAGEVELLVRVAGLEYKVVGYELDDDGNPNRTSWIVERVS